MVILIKDIFFSDGEKDVLIVGNKFAKIGKINSAEAKADKIIDAKNMAILPAFYNLHCHGAMCLLRGFCEDKPLFSWLQEIWKKEDTLTQEDIYDGTRLAVLEMIKSGTVFFADMYWYHKSVLQAVEQMNVRCNIGITFMDKLGNKVINDNFAFLDEYASYPNELISFSPAPHAIYTCSSELYKRCKENSEKNNLFLQTHLSETVSEVQDCKKLHQGQTPVEYLDKLGILDSHTIAAHCVHITDKDADILAKRKTVAVHNPCSNMKLSSGIFNMPLAKRTGMKVALGTDGCSSNNNLSMTEEMKTAGLLAKVSWNQTEVISSEEIFDMATKNGAEYYGINSGVIAEGKDADCILVDMNNEKLVPSWNLINNMVYSADTSCIDTVICNGKILMQGRKVEGEEEIIDRAKKFVKR